MGRTIYGKGESPHDDDPYEGWEDSADSQQYQDAQATVDEFVDSPADPEGDYSWSDWDSYDDGDRHNNAAHRVASEATSQVVSRIRGAGRAVDSKLDDASEAVIDGLAKIDDLLSGDEDDEV